MTSNVLLDQVENIIANNENNEKALIEQLKEDYITRAKAVSYIIDNNPDTANDIRELAGIADARMYQAKENYYQNTGIARRRQ